MRFCIGKTNVEVTFLFCILISFLVFFDKDYTVLFCFVFILFHELSHIISMLFCGVKIKSIAFEPFGIYIEKEEINLSATKNFLILVSGCAFNFGACFSFVIAFCVFKRIIFLKCAVINFSLFVFNALPVKNLDGGDTLYLILNEFKKVKNPLNTVKIVSVTVCALLFALGIILCVKVRFNPSLIISSVYLAFSLFLSP